MTTRQSIPESANFSFALGGLAGNNFQGAGFLAAALDAGMKPAMVTCTSGQIYWTYLYLTGLREGHTGSFLEEKANEYLNEMRPYPFDDANLWRMAVVGKPGVMRLAAKEWVQEVVANSIGAASKLVADWPNGFVTKAATEIWPERVAICEFPDSFFEAVANEFNDAAAHGIGVAFNAYHPADGIEVVHMNSLAFALNDKQPTNKTAAHRSRTTYDKITPQAVRDGLWIYQYGVAGRTGFDGCYFRQTMLSEAVNSPTVFVCRPINYKWLGDLPTTWAEGENIKTEVFMNGAYQGERDKIKLINKLIGEKKLGPPDYQEIVLEEIEIMAERGYYDYVLEDKSIFDQARAKAHSAFQDFKSGRKAAEPPALPRPGYEPAVADAERRPLREGALAAA